MWRLDNWSERLEAIDKEHSLDRFRDKDLVEAGADAMHKADVQWLKEHSYLLKYAKEGKVEITIKVEGEEWLAFTGGEIV